MAKVVGEAEVLAYCQKHQQSLSSLHDEVLHILCLGHEDPEVFALAERINAVCNDIEARHTQERIQAEFVPYDGCPKCGGITRYLGGKQVYTTEYCPRCELYTREWVMVKGVLLTRWTDETGNLWLPTKEVTHDTSVPVPFAAE